MSDRAWPVHEFTMKEILVPRTGPPINLSELTPMTIEAAYDPGTYADLLKHVEAEPQLVEIWKPAFLMSGVGQTWTLVKRFLGRVWLDDVRVAGSFEGEVPSAEITITLTEPEAK